MNDFICQNCGGCCGPVPVTITEYGPIRRAIKNMNRKEVDRLSNQKRGPLTCPLRDVENKRCSVYDARPVVCRLQGTQEGLECPHNLGVKLNTDGRSYIPKSPVLGILGETLRWPNLRSGLHD